MSFLREAQYRDKPPSLSIVDDILQDRRHQTNFHDAIVIRYFKLKEVNGYSQKRKREQSTTEVNQETTS